MDSRKTDKAEAAERAAAAGTVENPVQPGEVQPGDKVEQASNLGGPVDISPSRVPGKR